MFQHERNFKYQIVAPSGGSLKFLKKMPDSKLVEFNPRGFLPEGYDELCGQQLKDWRIVSVKFCFCGMKLTRHSEPIFQTTEWEDGKVKITDTTIRSLDEMVFFGELFEKEAMEGDEHEICIAQLDDHGQNVYDYVVKMTDKLIVIFGPKGREKTISRGLHHEMC